MKIRFHEQAGHAFGHPPRRLAFTLTEVMVASSILLMAVAGELSSHFFGMRMMTITDSKLNTSEKAHLNVRLLSTDIHSAKIVRVGNGNLSSFTEAAVNTQQQGSALQIYPSTDTNIFIRYFADAADKKLKRITNGAAGAYVVANSISNSLIFTAEDYAGKILTNHQNNCAIGMALDFYQLESSALPIGPGNYYKSYHLGAKITARAL